jgi:DsbC/DsbD-like thiol-disulfide interchange protein
VLVRLGRNLDLPATKTTAKHIEITSYPTDRVAAPGTRFSIVLDVTPASGIHVYAPGAKGYRPITLRIQPQPGLVAGDTSFPEPETYHFKPLDEHVLVYQRPFRIVQDVMIDPSRAAAAALKGVKQMTIDATLDYQACDDKICYLPQSVPLSWTIDLRPLDTERAKQR